MRQLAGHLQEQDFSSKSTSHSHLDGEDMTQADSSSRDQHFSPNPDGRHGKCNEASNISAPSLGTTDILPAHQVDYPESVMYLPYTYVDAYYGGVMAAYGSNAIVQPQLLSIAAPARVPLPVDLREGEPIYVNAKQYHGILRRRKHRAKLEAQNNTVKGRKPYLHESRHLHAMRRLRGSGGRFLNMKSQEQQQEESSIGAVITDSKNISCPSSFQSGKGGGLSDPANIGSSESTCSDVTSISDGDMYQLPETVGFPAGYHSNAGGEMQQNAVDKKFQNRWTVS